MAVATVIDHYAKVLNRIDRNIHRLLETSGDIVRSEAILILREAIKDNTAKTKRKSKTNGFLKGSIISEVSGGNAKIGSDLAYAARIELGYHEVDRLGRDYTKSSFKGYHMLTNALRNNTDNILRLFRKGLIK